MRVSVASLPVLSDRQGLLVGEMVASRDDPYGRPMLASTLSVRRRASDGPASIGFGEGMGGPLEEFGLCPIRDDRPDADPTPLLQHILMVVGGTSERARAVAGRIRNFANRRMAIRASGTRPQAPRGGLSGRVR